MQNRRESIFMIKIKYYIAKSICLILLCIGLSGCGFNFEIDSLLSNNSQSIDFSAYLKKIWVGKE